MLFGSYGFNGWLYSDMQFPDPDDPRHKLLFATETSIQKPAQTPVFLDPNWVGLWPLETDHPSRDLYAGIPFAVPTDSIAMVGMARCAVPARAVAGGTNILATLPIERVAPLHAARTSQRDVPTMLTSFDRDAT